MATITITGGTGMVGTALTTALIAAGHQIIILTRKAKPAAGNITYKQWDIEKGTIDEGAIQKADFLVHLAGENVAEGRWTEKRKQEIVDSRVKSGKLLVKALETIPNKIKALISASAIGWYGADPEIPNLHPFVESDDASNDFLGTTCTQWEAAIQPVSTLGKRLLVFRFGIVLSKEGGAFAEFRKPLQWGLATILGSGKQIISWIHIDDLVQMIIGAIENEKMQGVFNAVAPNPVSNKELILATAKAIRPYHIPVHVPAFALKLAMGEMSVEILKSATVSSRKIENTGMHFKYPTIEAAVEQLARK